MTQVNGWGFKRMTQGPDHNSYYHELFLRGLPHLCMKMRRPAKSKSSGNDVETNPDFYQMSMVAPLPNNTENATLNTVQPQDLLAGITNSGNAGSNPPSYTGLQSALNLQNSAIAPGFNMGLIGATPQLTNIDPSSLSSATELLQQHIQNQLQQQNSVYSTANTNQQTPNNAQNVQMNGMGNANYEASSGDSITSNGASDNLEVIKQRMKERSELVRQLKEVMDGSNPGPTNDTTNPTLNTTPAAQVTNNSTNAGNAPTPAAAQLQQVLPNMAGAPQVQQIMTQLAPSGHSIVPGAGIGALGLGQFPNAMIGGGIGMLGINGQLLGQPNMMASGPGAIPGMMNNGLTTQAGTSGASLQNLGIMAMQNPALLAQLQAANQMGNVQAAVNLYQTQHQQVPDMAGKPVSQASPS